MVEIDLKLCNSSFFQFQRRNRIYKEEQRQIRAAARKAKEEAEGSPAVAAQH
jgi:NADH dehydrogenase (ubiquinone) Fe-S protein 5